MKIQHYRRYIIYIINTIKISKNNCKNHNDETYQELKECKLDTIYLIRSERNHIMKDK